MNRRQFTASLAALTAAPTLPFAAATAPTTAVIPPGTYAWAQLIARAQNTCSPAMLMQHLHLSTDVATALFNDMVRDGVLRAPGLAGVARAAAPLQSTGAERVMTRRLSAKAKHLLDATSKDAQHKQPTPLVNQDPPGLGCDDTTPEDQTDARTDQPAQESPDRG